MGTRRRRDSRAAITARTRWAAVIGCPVDHSQSPALHNAAFAALGIDAVYLALAVAEPDLPAAVAGFRVTAPLGLSVTVPHKQAVVPLVDRVDSLAARIGAVNCIVREADGAFVGHNTDAMGYVDGLRLDLGYDPASCRAVVLGAGGAARAVFAGLEHAGAESIAVVARRPAAVDWVAAEPWTETALASLLTDADLLVDCTSTGLSPATEHRLPAPIDIARLPPTAVVSSLVYHRTPALVARAAERGLRTQTGAPMLLHQGARAFSLWTGRDAPLAAMRRALAGR